MALPTTITGISTAVACAGPFKSSGGNYYFIGRDGTTSTLLQAFSASDPTTSFSSAATVSTNGVSIRDVTTIAAFQDGDTIHVVAGKGTSVSSANDFVYVQFDMATSSFGTLETIQSAIDTRTSGLVGLQGVSVVVRSDGHVVVAYNGPRVANMGNSYSRIVAKRRTGTNTWVAADGVTNPTPLDAGGQVDYVAPKAVLGSSDRTHFFWYSSTGNAGAHRALTSANALQTANTSGPGLFSGGFISGLSYDVSGTQKLLAYFPSSNSQRVWYGDSANTPTLSLATPTATDQLGRLFHDDGIAYQVTRASDSDLYIQSSSDHGATWGSQTNIFTATISATEANLSVDGAVYQRGSDFVIPYVVNDNGTLKYNEYVVRTVSSGVTRNPGQGNLALSPTAPSAARTDHKAINPAARDLALSPTAPTRVVEERRDPAQGNLALSATAPSVVQTAHVALSPSARDLSLSVFAPALVQTTSVAAAPASRDLSLSSVAPSVAQTTNADITPARADLSLSAVAPAVVQTTTVLANPAQANLVLSATAPAVEVSANGIAIAPAQADLSLSAAAPALTLDVRRDPAAVDLALSSFAPATARTDHVALAPAVRDLVLSTAAPALVQTTNAALAPAARDLALSSFAPTLTQTTAVNAEPAAANLALSSAAPVASAGLLYVPGPRDLVLSADAPVRVVDQRRDPAQANLSLSATAPAAVQDVRRDPAQASLSLSTFAPTVVQTTNVAAVPARADLLLSAAAPTVSSSAAVTIEPASANLVLSGFAPAVAVTAHVVAAPAGADLVLSANAPGVAQTAHVAFSPAARDLALSVFVPSVTQTTNVAAVPARADLSLSTFAPVVAIETYLTPDADLATGTWTNQSGGSELFSALDEAVIDDADYIKSAAAPVNDLCKIGLSDPSGVMTEPFVLEYRYAKDGADRIDLTVRLVEGVTEIAVWTHSDIDVSFLTVEQTLTAPQFAAIVNPNNLHVEFEANAP